MDIWTKLTEFFACGLLVLPSCLGLGLHSFDVFAATLALMQVAMIVVMTGAPSVAPAPDEAPKKSGQRRD
jgi:hypothetical protein